MGLGSRRGKMWAGVMDGHIATETDQSRDEYTPLSVALFASKADAKKHYEMVVEVDVDKLLKVDK